MTVFTTVSFGADVFQQVFWISLGCASEPRNWIVRSVPDITKDSKKFSWYSDSNMWLYSSLSSFKSGVYNLSPFAEPCIFVISIWQQATPTSFCLKLLHRNLENQSCFMNSFTTAILLRNPWSFVNTLSKVRDITFVLWVRTIELSKHGFFFIY